MITVNNVAFSSSFGFCKSTNQEQQKNKEQEKKLEHPFPLLHPPSKQDARSPRLAIAEKEEGGGSRPVSGTGARDVCRNKKKESTAIDLHFLLKKLRSETRAGIEGKVHMIKKEEEGKKRENTEY